MPRIPVLNVICNSSVNTLSFILYLSIHLAKAYTIQHITDSLMATKETTTSKRSALRFSGYDRPLTYKTDYENGEARLVNISSNGCAISGATTPFMADDKLLLAIALDDPENPVQIQAKVIRVEDNNFGLHFLNLAEEIKQRLTIFFAKENHLRKAQKNAD